MICECGHDVLQHGATGICLFGYNASIAKYSDGRHGDRKCECNEYHPVIPPLSPPRCAKILSL
jgi:hypothetical protein